MPLGGLETYQCRIWMLVNTIQRCGGSLSPDWIDACFSRTRMRPSMPADLRERPGSTLDVCSSPAHRSIMIVIFKFPSTS